MKYFLPPKIPLCFPCKPSMELSCGIQTNSEQNYAISLA